ncbi:hypothetical protein TrLO_g576 [Triparma laevis f. longispina]|uniref:Uncharacterized protein n=1 Tax=Triparma laevis f. longispina TaxID=1714387 RepID=A0A9W7A8C0_9STRA|nr:hypothetical protein TrLO_g576 [Triparma laevis f. longispina]
MFRSILFILFSLALVCLAQAQSPVAVTGEIENKLIFKALLKLAGITDVDVDTCFKDVTSTETSFRDFSSDVQSKLYKAAIIDLNKALLGFETSIHDCGVPEIETKIASIATALKFAKISDALDSALSIVIDATDVAVHITDLSVDIISGDADKIAQDITDLLNDWEKIAGDCTAESCKFIDGFLKILQVVAVDITGPCLADLEKSFDVFNSGVAAFESKNYTLALSDFALGFDDLATTFGNDECKLATLGKLIEPLSEKIGEAIIDGDSIIINAANIYDDIYQAVKALQNKDYNLFGMEVGKLVAAINTAGCKSAACRIFIGLLESAQLVATDYTVCIAAIDDTGADFEAAINAFSAKDYKTGLTDIAKSVKDLSDDVTACDVAEFAKILEDMAAALGADNLVKEIGAIALILVEGQDITNDIDTLVVDYNAGDMAKVGRDLGAIATFLSDEVHCTNIVCKIVEGILEGAEIVLTDLKICEADFLKAEDDFVNGWAAFKTEDKKTAVEDISKGIRQIGVALSDCGLKEELAFFEHEANVFGLSNVTALDKAGEAVAILIHGFDFYDNVLDMVADVEKHDFRAAGKEVQTIMDDLSKWSTGHVCQNTWCYVVEGIMEAEAIIEGDVRQCEADFEDAWQQFENAVAQFTDQVALANQLSQKLQIKTKMGLLLSKDEEALKLQISNKVTEAVKDIGKGLEDIARGVEDCHLEDFADLLTKLAAELAVPEVSWIAEVLHILVHSVEIVDDIGLACEDFGDENWVRFGFDIAKLIKVLL